MDALPASAVFDSLIALKAELIENRSTFFVNIKHLVMLLRCDLEALSDVDFNVCSSSETITI